MINYATLALALPKSAQSDKWAPHACVALAVMGATDAASMKQQIDDASAEIRRKMVAKYKVEF